MTVEAVVKDGKDVVSTLLEILVVLVAPAAVGAFPHWLFQPFLRFWLWGTSKPVEELAPEWFQPFLRFYGGLLRDGLLDALRCTACFNPS